jgi:hypothetical protein
MELDMLDLAWHPCHPGTAKTKTISGKFQKGILEKSL